MSQCDRFDGFLEGLLGAGIIPMRAPRIPERKGRRNSAVVRQTGYCFGCRAKNPSDDVLPPAP